MDLKLHTSFDQLDQKQWQNLVLKTGAPVFMLPDYQIPWWQNEGAGELLIFGLYEGNELLGLAPFYVEKKVLRFVGAVAVSDYLDFVVRNRHREEMIKGINEWLQQNHDKWANLRFESLAENSPSLPLLKKFFPQAEESQQEVCPVITLPRTSEAYWQMLPKKNASQFKKLLRSIGEDDEITYRVIETSDELKKAMPVFIELHKKSGADKKAFWTRKREQFFIKMATELAKQKIVKLYFLDVNGVPAASLFVFDYNNQFLLYNSGFDATNYGYLGVGNAIILHTIEEAIKLGKTRYDFMRGNEKYKYLFGAEDEPLYDLELHAT